MENSCFRKVKIPVKENCPQGMQCFKEKIVQRPCKERCVNGKLSQDMPDGRRAGDSCKDAEE